MGQGNAPITLFSCKWWYGGWDHLKKQGRENFLINLDLFWVKFCETLHERKFSKLSDCMTWLFKANDIKILIDWEKIFRPYGESPVTKCTPRSGTPFSAFFQSYRQPRQKFWDEYACYPPKSIRRHPTNHFKPYLRSLSPLVWFLQDFELMSATFRNPVFAI